MSLNSIIKPPHQLPNPALINLLLTRQTLHMLKQARNLRKLRLALRTMIRFEILSIPLKKLGIRSRSQCDMAIIRIHVMSPLIAPRGKKIEIGLA